MDYFYVNAILSYRHRYKYANFELFHHNRYKLTDEKPTNQSRLNPSKREYPRLNRKPQKARKNLVNHANH